MNLKLHVIVAVVLLLASCQSVPQTRSERTAIVDESRAQLEKMIEKDPQLEPLLEESAGYVVFPEVGKGGLLIGGAFGRGAVFERGGRFAGYATIKQASVGGVVGGQMYAELLVFQAKEHLDSFKAGENVRFGAQATAVAITEGTASTTTFDNGVAVFILPRGGLMADASLSGQTFTFVRPEDVEKESASAAMPMN